MILHAYCDGSGGSPRGSSCAAVLVDPETGDIIEERAKVLEKCSNNVAEYEGMILAIEMAKDRGVSRLKIHSDSQLIVNQTNGIWKIKHDDLRYLKEKAWVVGAFIEDSLELVWIPREKNSRADALCTEALNAAFPKPQKKSRPSKKQKRNAFMQKLREKS